MPAGTNRIALIAEVADATGSTINHLVVWNIDPTLEITEEFRASVKTMVLAIRLITILARHRDHIVVFFTHLL